MWTIDAAQQAHVHRTQNAGQPVSGVDSLVPIGQVSGTTSELMPLASAISTASTEIRRALRISAIYQFIARLTPRGLSTSTGSAYVSPANGDGPFFGELDTVHNDDEPGCRKSENRRKL